MISTSKYLLDQSAGDLLVPVHKDTSVSFLEVHNKFPYMVNACITFSSTVCRPILSITCTNVNKEKKGVVLCLFFIIAKKKFKKGALVGFFFIFFSFFHKTQCLL